MAFRRPISPHEWVCTLNSEEPGSFLLPKRTWSGHAPDYIRFLRTYVIATWRVRLEGPGRGVRHDLWIGQQMNTHGALLYDVLIVEDGSVLFGWIDTNLLTLAEALRVALTFYDQRGEGWAWERQ